MIKCDVLIIGGGVAGNAAADGLADDGLSVVIAEKSRGILYAGKNAPYHLIHKSGLEYINKGDPQTGWDVSDGAIAIKGFYGPPIETLIAHEENRTQFGLANECLDEVSVDDFFKNVALMVQRYQRNWDYIKGTFNLSDKVTDLCAFGPVSDFIRRLPPEQWKARNIAAAVADTTTAINREYFVKFWQERLREKSDKIKLMCGLDARQITPGKERKRRVLFGDDVEIEADCVVLTAGKDIPLLASRTVGAVRGPEGNIMVNFMTKLRPPPTTDLERQRLQRSILFTVKGPKAGGTWVCLEGPTATKSGEVVSYVPNPEASQYKVYPFTFGAGDQDLPKEIEYLIHGVSKLKPEERNRRIAKLLGAVHHHYPWADNVTAEHVSELMVNAVFTPKYADRAQRPIEPVTYITEDGSVCAKFASKWTTHIPDALEVRNHVRKLLLDKELPTNKDYGVSRGNFDLAGSLGKSFMAEPRSRAQSTLLHRALARAEGIGGR